MRSCTNCTYRGWTIDKRDASLDDVVRSVSHVKRSASAWAEAGRS
jgi:hypothetical protein